MLIKPKGSVKQVALPRPGLRDHRGNLRLCIRSRVDRLGCGVASALVTQPCREVANRADPAGRGRARNRDTLVGSGRLLLGPWNCGRVAGGVGPIDRMLVWFFGVFNTAFRLATNGYSRIIALSLKGSVAALVVYGGLLYLTYDKFQSTPAGFIPVQDMGYLLCNVQLPDSTSLERTKQVIDQVRGDRQEDSGHPIHPGDHRAIASAQRKRLELRLDVLHPRSRSRSGGHPTSTARRSSPSSRSDSRNSSPRRC